MALTITVRSGDAASPPTITFDSPKIVLGRGEGCEVRLPDPSVSHRHASIQQRGTDYIVVDEGSTNGTFVGPVRLSPGAPRVLTSGDVLRLGRFRLDVRIESVPPTRQPHLATKEVALSLVAGALEAQGDPACVRVRVVEGPDQGLELALDGFDRAYVAGRSSSADLCLTDTDASRRHVEIRRRGGGLFVTDFGSKNGSALDGEPLAPGEKRPWTVGSPLTIGQDVIVFDDPLSEALAELERGPDEALDDNGELGEPSPADETTDHDEPASTRTHSTGSEHSAAPIAKAPLREPGARTVTAGGWRAADLLVGLFALVVLGLSLMGLWWLFRVD
jgi:pSer/pThr/pTyr-binding forkhead associated (FHA) protein